MQKKGFMPELWDEPCIADRSATYEPIWFSCQNSVLDRIPFIDLSAAEQRAYDERVTRDHGQFHDLQAKEGEERATRAMRFLVRAQDANGHLPFVRVGSVVCFHCKKCLIE